MTDKCFFEVIIGTYEQFVLGYKFVKSESGKKLVQSFANHSHHGTVKSVAASGKWLASSSSDETIHLYDMLSRKECGQLIEQNGTISSIAFTPDTSHLISASEDGSIAIFKTGSWQMEKLWDNAHKGSGVTQIAVHPSGKMALSLGKDNSLRTWNLVKGRPAYTTNLSRCKTPLEMVVWSNNGEYYALPMNTKIELFSVSTAAISHVFNFKTKVTAALFINDNVLCVGEESGELSGQCTETGLELWRLSGDKRVRGIATHKKYIVTGCSSGAITVYKMTSPAEEPTFLTSTSADCRLTCLTIHTLKNSKRKVELNDDVEDESTSVVESPLHSLDKEKKKKKKRKLEEDDSISKEESNDVVEDEPASFVESPSNSLNKVKKKKKKFKLHEDDNISTEETPVNIKLEEDENNKVQKRKSVERSPNGGWKVTKI